MTSSINIDGILFNLTSINNFDGEKKIIVYEISFSTELYWSRDQIICSVEHLPDKNTCSWISMNGLCMTVDSDANYNDDDILRKLIAVEIMVRKTLDVRIPTGKTITITSEPIIGSGFNFTIP